MSYKSTEENTLYIKMEKFVSDYILKTEFKGNKEEMWKEPDDTTLKIAIKV
tara:strand:- start:211 stop:363 length:153 start_codon:yes stop_codon:yes gene_type:complete